jgi:hypothetical protein
MALITMTNASIFGVAIVYDRRYGG